MCANGIEAYDMIMDDSPDIVLTDIRMPGMDGLELIKKVYDAMLPVQFIILSGYEEFEYARTAMKYRVKHYLLKPCNEHQIIDSIQDCIRERYRMDIFQTMTMEQFAAQSNMLYSAAFSILNEYVCQERELTDIIPSYEPYIDFDFTPYHLFYIHYLPLGSLDSFLDSLNTYVKKSMPQTLVYGAYVNCTLLLFFPCNGESADILESYIQTMQIGTETKIESYPSLRKLLSQMLPRLKRFSTIYYIHNFHAVYICNYSTVISQMQSLAPGLQKDNPAILENAAELLEGIGDADFLKQLANGLLFHIVSSAPGISAYELTEWLIQIHQETDLPALRKMVIEKLKNLSSQSALDRRLSSMTQQICDYVNQNLHDPNMSLKYIAENHLFMNVDYVSKKFYKETGTKFSQYLTSLRIQKAKKLIIKRQYCNIQEIAEQVGYGNNPQYFSQLFKKITGSTPSAFIAKLNVPQDI